MVVVVDAYVTAVNHFARLKDLNNIATSSAFCFSNYGARIGWGCTRAVERNDLERCP